MAEYVATYWDCKTGQTETLSFNTRAAYTGSRYDNMIIISGWDYGNIGRKDGGCFKPGSLFLCHSPTPEIFLVTGEGFMLENENSVMNTYVPVMKLWLGGV